jgi:hypothetical protein
MRPQKSQAYGRPEADGFLVRKGTTAMRDGSPSVKRDREQRDRLVRQGILVPDSDLELYRFSRDHLFQARAWLAAWSRMETVADLRLGTAARTGKHSRILPE